MRKQHRVEVAEADWTVRIGMRHCAALSSNRNLAFLPRNKQFAGMGCWCAGWFCMFQRTGVPVRVHLCLQISNKVSVLNNPKEHFKTPPNCGSFGCHGV